MKKESDNQPEKNQPYNKNPYQENNDDIPF
jgi:hypothetical protein